MPRDDAPMADLSEIEAIESELQSVTKSHRAFFVPIARAISELGGVARKRDVEKRLRELLKDELSEKQLDYLEANNRYGWARSDMKKQGLIGGEYGYWELTPVGRLYADSHAADELKIDLDIPEAKAPGRSSVETESVRVTGFGAYEIPLLEVMAKGVTAKKQILDELKQALHGQLLPGDLRTMPLGKPVWEFRANWSISSLGKDGFIENVGTGVWSITSAGRERLEAERSAWDITAFHNAKAKVRIEGSKKSTLHPSGAWSSPAWTELAKRLPKGLLTQLEARLRPDLGPSPDVAIPRNIVLYGPPGTGKTYLAKQVASALADEADGGEDGRFRLLQFHPSYAYEDFVQGLRPDLKQTQLRYQLQKGPFLRVAEAAAQEPDAFFVLIIDEINRGDPARIFGELLYALEYRDENVTLPLGGELSVPSNLIIIGTMNSVDRSVALVDYALRRRFGFIRVDPNPEVISEVRDHGLLADAGPDVLEKFNGWLAKRLGRDYTLGHSFFISPSIPDDDPQAFDKLWRSDVLPLLEEYFFGDEDGLEQASKQWKSIVDDAVQSLADVKADDEAQAEDGPGPTVHGTP